MEAMESTGEEALAQRTRKILKAEKGSQKL